MRVTGINGLMTLCRHVLVYLLVATLLFQGLKLDFNFWTVLLAVFLSQVAIQLGEKTVKKK